MSDTSQTKQHIAIIGAGCAGLSLAARLTNRKHTQISLYGPDDNRPDHIWGFWQMPHLKAAAKLSTKHWLRWQISDHKSTITHVSAQHPYHALSAQTWLSDCRAHLGDVPHYDQKLAEDAPLPEADIIADSRPKAPSKGALLQHFLGIELETDKAVFDPDTAILMDFRTDQSRGIHFLYMLPFTDRRALVESTYFTTETLPESIYEADITTYLQDIFGISEFTEIRREAGVIPMESAKARTPKDKRHKFIGGAGGAIRPSSGYAFGFIQKQIFDISANRTLDAKPPHSPVDIWMDRVFLDVLHRYQPLGPNLFMAMASRLTGSEFARFMSGQAKFTTLLKIILAMPKMTFFHSALSVISGTSKS